MLTHVKEKLQFVEKENLKLVQRLEELEGSLSSKKDKLQDLKLHRDKSRQRVARMREQKTTVSQPMLIDDLQQQRLRRNELKAQVERAKVRSAEVAG